MNEPVEPNAAKANLDQMLFVGGSCVFPDVTLRVVRAEFDSVGVTRVDGFDASAWLSGSGVLRLVLIDDRFADMLTERFDDIRERFVGAQIALAYHDADIARRLFALQQTEGRLNGLRFIPMNAPVESWISMLRLLLAGDFIVPGDLVAAAAREPQGAAPTGASSVAEAALTQREIEVLERAAKGYRNKTIADDLGVSEHTVKLHIHHIITKIGVQNRTAAANWYLTQDRADGNSRSAA